MNAPLLLTALALAAPVPTRPVGEAVPTTLPPRLVIAQADGGRLKVRETYSVVVPVIQKVNVERGGKVETETRTTYVQEVRTTESARAFKDFRFLTAGGKKVDPAAVAERLKKPTAVLITQGGPDVHSLFRAALKDDTLILVPVGPSPLAPAAPALPAPKPANR
jgi:hypothetical protein